ncbi:hypothetical protein V7S43_010842 [Phytophthora oleae]|uniref:M96 mating-specific protein family n=1 Tax=Phytophthora oleae TaxID=2107226 RepID=A0ABD3FB06_9STRA
MNVPIAITSSHGPSQVVDEDLIEALGYFSEDVSVPTQVPSTPLDLGACSPPKFSEKEPTDEAVHAMLLSLEVQDLFSSDEKDKVVPVKSSKISSSPVQQQEQQTSPKKIDRRLRPFSTCKRRNRRRPKHELEYLRAKVLELQEELETLNKAEVGSPSAVSQETALAKTGLSSWKEIAERQKHEVDSSFAENRRLRNRLLGQLQVARVLEAAIGEHQKETGGSIRGVGWPTTVTSTDHEIFAQLNDSVEKQFAEINTVLTTSGLSKVLHELSGGLEFKREANGISFRHEETRLLPFEMQSLHQALWNCLHSDAVVKQTHAQMLSQDHSNLVIRETIELAKSRINVMKRAVFRRHIEKNRVVFVWSSSVEIDGSVSVRLREKGWSTCSTFEFYRGVNAGASRSSNFVQGCMARMAVQLTPEVSEFQSDLEAQRHIGEMTDLIVGTYHQNFGLIHEVVEKVLVKPSRPRPNPSFAVC